MDALEKIITDIISTLKQQEKQQPQPSIIGLDPEEAPVGKGEKEDCLPERI